MALFDEITDEELLEEALDNAPDDIDTRQGSVFRDAIAGVVNIMARLFSEAGIIAEQSSVITASGENLDLLAKNLYLNKLSREKAVTAKYSVNIEASEGIELSSLDLEEDDRFFTENGLYFLLKYNLDDDDNIISYYVEAEEAGSEFNNIVRGTNLVPVSTVDYLASITIQNVIENGVDEESDDDFRKRIQELLSAPAENANEQNYKSWCEQIDGVGTATIYPLFAGPNTVKAVLTDSNNQPCSPEVVKNVQDFIDPITRNTQVTYEGITYTVGDGIGGGIAPLGAHFLAVSANNDVLTITIVGISFSNGMTDETAKAKITTALNIYFKSLVDDYNADIQIKIKIVDLISVVSSVVGVDDFSAIKINDSLQNYIVAAGYIPTTDTTHIVFEEAGT